MPTYDEVVLNDNPVAYWKCEELAPPPPLPNLNLIDSSGNGFNGSLLPNSDGGLVQGITGPILTDGTSFGTAGATGRIPNLGSADGTLLDLRNTQTWECWGKHTAGGVNIFVNRGGDTTNTYISFGQRSTGNFVDNVNFVMRWGSLGNGKLIISCALPRDPDKWWHIAAVRDENEMWLYVDGWLVAYTDTAPTGPMDPGPNLPWRLGYMTNLVFGPVNWTQGISHVALYDAALTQSQLRIHIVAALGFLPDNPCGDTPTIEVGCPNAEGVVGEPYSSEVTVIGGTPPYTFAITSGALPDGLTLDPDTGAITGTPTTGGTFDFTVQVTDSELNTGESPGCQVIISASPPVPPPFVPPPVRTFEFDAAGSGQAVNWFIVPQLSDYGDELRDKVIKAIRVTGKVHDATAKIYTYGPAQNIDVDQIDDGSGSRTAVALADCDRVQQSKRYQVNCPNAMLSTVRIEGTWDGEGERDRIDEIVIEAARQGIRR